MKTRLSIAVLLLLLTEHPCPSIAADPGVPAPSGAASADPRADLAARRQQVAQRIAAAQSRLDALQEKPSADKELAERIARQIELLKQLDALESQLESSIEARWELESAKADYEQKLADLRRDGPAEERPYSFLLLDSLRDALSTEESHAGETETAIAAASTELDHARQQCDEKQAERRRIKEQLEKAGDAKRKASLAAELELTELEAEVAEQSLAVRRAELEAARFTRTLEEVHAKLLEEKLEWVRKDTVFSQVDLQKQLFEIERQETDLKQDLKASEAALEELAAQCASARKLDPARPQTPAVGEQEKVAKLARYCQLRRTALVQKQLEFLTLLRRAWQCRFALANGHFETADLAAWEAEHSRALDQLNNERKLESLMIDEMRKELADLDQRLEAAKEKDAELAQWIDKEQLLYRQLIDAHSTSLVKLESNGKTHQNLLDEIQEKRHHHSLAVWLSEAKEQCAAIWNRELVTIDDKRAVTVGKLVKGIALLVLGIWLSRRITHGFAQKILCRLGVQEGVAVAVQTLTFYLLSLTSALMALHLVHVPLTVFTFMGGAVAIGVGFGSQKILNNFISGVILLIESPIRVGDLIEMGTLQGKVHTIGTRSTRIRTGANLEIIVPNSALLENNVTNWTLTDAVVRSSIRVGVAYGSPTRDVARWLKHAADEHGQVLKKPEPCVWFTNFSENTLDFELNFWIDIHQTDRRRVESDLRFMIDERLRDAGITIAFPQRDVHLDISRPLEVSLVSQADSQQPAEPTANRKAA